MNVINAESLEQSILYALPFIILIPSFLIFFIVKSIKTLSTHKNDKPTYVLIIFFIVLLLSALLFFAMTEIKQFVFMVIDSSNKTIDEKTGIITDAHNMNSLTGTYVLVDKTKYYCGWDIARYAEDRIGKHCDITFAKTSHYIIMITTR